MSRYELRDRRIIKISDSTVLRPRNLRSSEMSTSGGRKRAASAANLMCSTQSDKVLLSQTSKSLNKGPENMLAAAIDMPQASGSGFQSSSSSPDCVSQIEKDKELERKLQASPDPVLQVMLFEEDEQYAQRLQNSYIPAHVARQIEADEKYARSLQHFEGSFQQPRSNSFKQVGRAADEEENDDSDTSDDFTDLTNDERADLTNEVTDYAIHFGGTTDDEDMTDYDEEEDSEEAMDLIGTRPLSVSEINRLPVKVYEASSITSTDCIRECHICMSEYQSGEQIRILPCFHEFHAACIDLWLDRNNTCPICRVNVTLEDESDILAETINLQDC